MTAAADTNALRMALTYAAMGWAVVPMRWPNEGACSCLKGADCPRPAKHPLTEHGVKDATTDEATITAWWTRWPRANVGIACGAVSGFVVVDIDPRSRGDESLASLISSCEALPETPLVATGGGGRHYYFAYQPGLAHRLAEGIDLLSDGKIATAPCSWHVSGAVYRWEVPPW
jgi:hypothetical protein